MSKNYPVAFKHCNNTPELSENTLKWARNIAHVLSSRREQLTSQFVFRSISQQAQLPEFPPFDYPVREIYKAHITSIRELDESEELMCGYLQDLMDAQPSRNHIRKAIGYIVEYFHMICKKSKHRGCVTHQANLLVDGTKVTYLGKEEIDIGVDRLDSAEALEMCECKTQVKGFNDKPEQIDFYGHAFHKIREIVDPNVTLTMELVAGFTSSRGFTEVPIPVIFDSNNVRVIGISLASGQVSQLN